MYFNKAMSIALFGKAVTSPNTKGILKSELDIENFTARDFLSYWKSKAREKGLTYIPVKYKDNAVFKSLISNFKKEDIKTMIDYLWDSGDKIFTKDGQLQYSSYGVFLLSNAWLNAIYNKSLKWKNGEVEIENRGRVETKEAGVTIDF